MAERFEVTPELKDTLWRALLERGNTKRIGGEEAVEFRCVADGHEDRNPSSHYSPRKGVWKCRSCGAGGGTIDLCRRLGIDYRGGQEKAPPRPRPAVQRDQEPVATYEYVHHGTTYLKQRYEFPDVLQPKGKPEKTFVWKPRFPEGVQTADMPLFWSFPPDSKLTDPVVFVEGEEVVKALKARGILAASGAWGGSQRSFGDSPLRELAGRTVWLSPDNDRVGREYMDAIAAELKNRHLNCKIRWVRVPLGEGEDLHDYFRRGGDVEAIWQGDFSQPVTEYKGPDEINVTIGVGELVLRFEASNIQRTERSLDCRLRVTSVNEPEPRTATSQRINMISMTARNQLRLDLSRFFETPRDVNWTVALNDVAAELERAYLEQENGVDLFDVDEYEQDDAELIPGFLLEGQPTVFYGDGESLKTYVSLLAASCVGLGHPFFGRHATRHGTVLYVDYENATQRGLKRRVSRVLKGLGDNVMPETFRYWDGRGLSFASQYDLILQEVRRNNVRLLVIDSGAPALGGEDPNDSTAVLAFFNTLARLRVTSIIIAHVSKTSDLEKPFGSVHWHNQARRTFLFRRGEDTGVADRAHLGIYCKKANETGRTAPLAVQVDFYGRDGEVVFEQADWLKVPKDLDRLRPWRLRIMDALRDGARSTVQIADTLGSKPETIGLKLKQYSTDFVKIDQEDGKAVWGLRAS